MTSQIDRRTLLTLGAAFGATLAVPRTVRGAERLFAATQGSTIPYAGDSGLILVTIQLGGGNDGLNTIVPINDPTLRALRGESLPTEQSLHRLDGDFALHAMPYLAQKWAADDLAVVHGVASPEPSLSHFASTDVWARGSMDPGATSGWVGRALERSSGVDVDPLIALTLGGMPITLHGEQTRTMTLPVTEEYLAWSPMDSSEAGPLLAIHEQLAAAAPDDAPLAAHVRAGHRAALDLGERVGPITDRAIEAQDDTDPESEDPALEDTESGELDQQLQVAADLIRAGLPTRAYQVAQGDYDTHEGQVERHRLLLVELDSAIQRFYERLGDMADRVVVATWSEFGRRPAFNGSGTDHGTASVALVVGRPIAGGHHGEPVDMGRLDRDDNLVGAIDFRRYLGGVGQAVFDVDGADIVEHESPLELRA